MTSHARPACCIHRIGARVPGAFLSLHLLNHLLAIASPQAHIAFMEGLRAVYRNRLVEAMLLTCAASQIGSGLSIVRRRWRNRHEGLDWPQLASGGYLAFCLLVHVGAVLAGRRVLHLDTNPTTPPACACCRIAISSYRIIFAPCWL